MSELLEKILNRENMNKAYKRVKANKGTSGIDEITIEDALCLYKRKLGTYQSRNHRKEVQTTASKAS